MAAPGLTVGIAYLATAVVHVRKGFTWAEMRRVAMWPPAWWPFGWPARWRRPEDLWARLPRMVRGVRAVYGLIAGAVIVALPLAIDPIARRSFVVALEVAVVAVSATMVFVAWWAHRSGIPNNADLRSLFLRSPADRRFWKRPQMAKRLLPAVVRIVDRRPDTSAEYVRLIVEDTKRMTGSARDAGLRSAEVARLAFAALEGMELPPDRRARVLQRLDSLWSEHRRVLRGDSDPAAEQLTVLARSLEQYLGDRVPDADDETQTIRSG